MRSPQYLGAQLVGAALGIGLGFWGAQRTRFLMAGERLYYVPHTYTGIAVSLLFVGRLEPRKGVMVLLKAYRRLCVAGLPVRLLIAGGGAEEATLRRFVTENRLPGVDFLGVFDDADAPALYASCDIFCAPSIYGESFGVVLAEALGVRKSQVELVRGTTSRQKHFLIRDITPDDLAARLAGVLGSV